jgi:PPK2 family polyphosphate:nucleotide phosphotransferase
VTENADRWRITPGTRPDLTHMATTPEDAESRSKTESATEALEGPLADLQGRLWAEGTRALLVVLQGLDASGKDGTVRKVFRGMDPQGVRVTPFKAPTAVELAHDFLWRIHANAPARGELAVFNRSHYEDVLIARIDHLVPEDVWRRRYDHIRAFEHVLISEGTTIVKIFLHVSADEQAERLQSRLDDPAKAWKFDPADLKAREKWALYEEAYADAIFETATDESPWYVVPADKKWYRNWVVRTILHETLAGMNPRWPAPVAGQSDITFD